MKWLLHCRPIACHRIFPKGRSSASWECTVPGDWSAVPKLLGWLPAWVPPSPYLLLIYLKSSIRAKEVCWSLMNLPKIATQDANSATSHPASFKSNEQVYNHPPDSSCIQTHATAGGWLYLQLPLTVPTIQTPQMDTEVCGVQNELHFVSAHSISYYSILYFSLACIKSQHQYNKLQLDHINKSYIIHHK